MIMLYYIEHHQPWKPTLSAFSQSAQNVEQKCEMPNEMTK